MPPPEYRSEAAETSESGDAAAPRRALRELSSPAMERGATRATVRKISRDAGLSRPQLDAIAVEEPLEVRLAWRERDADRRMIEKPIAVTMRTPGSDRELALGFLFGEGMVRTSEQVAACTAQGSVVRVELSADAAPPDLTMLERHSYVSASCGVCGKASIDAVRVRRTFSTAPGPKLDARIVHGLPAALRTSQSVFDTTGGLHAAALFDAAGRLEDVREDVGRHNAVDKLVGSALLAGRIPLEGRILLLSGRASFELLQKAAMAGIPVVAAIGAPSSLAVDMAAGAGITLLGFVREDRFNVYTGAERLTGLSEERDG